MKKRDVKQFVKDFQRPLLLLAVILIMTALRPTMFLKPSNISSILLAISIYGLMVCGTIFPLLIGGIDLSIGSICALSGCTTILLTRYFNYSTAGAVLGILCGLALGALCGFLDGYISCKFAIPAFVVSLAMKNVVLGLAQRITNKNTISCMDSKLINFIGTGRVLGLPMPIILFLVLMVITWFVLNRTVFGRRVYAVGGNPVAARFTGINSRRIQILCYTLSGLAAGLTGIVLSCFNSQCIASQGSGYDGDVLVALVVGGVSMAGGEGSIQGAFFGTLLMGILSNALVLLGVESIYHEVVTGIVVILAVAVDMYGRTKDNGLKQKHHFLSEKKSEKANNG